MTVKEIKAYARENYEKGGDVIIECYTDDEIQSLLVDTGTTKEELDILFSSWNDQYQNQFNMF